MTTLHQFSTQNTDESVSKSSATEPLHGPRSPENSCKETPQKLKRKRVRRERIELDKLRLESHKLETELALLQGIYKGRVPHEIHSKRRVAANSKTTHGYQLIAPRKKETQFVWQDIAQRQLQERWRAQTTNKELREQLQAECELARQMMVLLHRNANAKVPFTTAMSCLFNGFVNDQHLAALGALSERKQMLHNDDEAVFKDQAVRA
ncbi:hypothetical protein PI124_g8154 [Phytophthora idaei]|nr:hypothetical protein PI125_g8245 [Phytophthora idaei]KAG3247128.1 hypothetical protein PI124_g8154 [Phytophthora idaei]